MPPPNDTQTSPATGAAVPTGSVSFSQSEDGIRTTRVAGVRGSARTITNAAGSTATFTTAWTPTAAGTYYWLASYAGDANNNSFTTTCGEIGRATCRGKG